MTHSFAGLVSSVHDALEPCPRANTWDVTVLCRLYYSVFSDHG